MKKLFLILALAAVSTGAFAQDKLSFGVEGGVNMSNFSHSVPSGVPETSTDMKLGFQLGGYVDYSLTDMIFLEGGLYGIMRGASQSESAGGMTTEMSANPIYLQVPIMVGFNFPLSDGIALNAKIGPYVAYGIAGNSKSEISGSPAGILDGSNSEKFFDDHTNALDFGGRIRVGAEFNKITLGLFYDLGLANMIKDAPTDYSAKNYSIGLSVGYKF